MPTYSDAGDLLVGDIPLPKGLRAQKYVDNATDEIDSMIGFIYQTPLNLSEESPIVRPVRLLIKRIANDLASGMLIMAMSTGGQRMDLHAYGNKLVSDARAILQQIANGDIILIGAPKVEPGEGQDPQFTGPQIANVDAESNVEAFYGRISNPNYNFPPVAPVRLSGEQDLVR